jgi:hypothetical protein
MIETKSHLTTVQIDDIFQSMPAAELWQLNADVEPIQINSTQKDFEKTEQIYAIMDATDLAYDEVEKILFNPKSAVLGDIEIYCKRLNINISEFIEKALA